MAHASHDDEAFVDRLPIFITNVTRDLEARLRKTECRESQAKAAAKQLSSRARSCRRQPQQARCSSLSGHERDLLYHVAWSAPSRRRSNGFAVPSIETTTMPALTSTKKTTKKTTTLMTFAAKP